MSQSASAPDRPDDTSLARAVTSRLRPRGSRAAATPDCAVNEAAIAARSNSHPPPSATRGTGAGAKQARRKKQRAEPADHGDAGEQTQPPDFTIAGLTQQLQLQRPLGALTLRFELLALELQAPRVAIERLFQRGDDHGRQPRVEAPGATRRLRAADPRSAASAFRPRAKWRCRGRHR